jgi:hypothetical protein
MNPLRRLWEFVFVSAPARFPSDFSVSQSVERLRAHTKRTIFSALFRQAAVGPVSESRVRLQRVIPMFGNSFKPIYVGAFTLSQGRVVLEGRFTMYRTAKAFMCIWFSIGLTIVAVALVGALKAIVEHRLGDQPVVLLAPLGPLAFLLGGVGFVRGCWWLSRGDIPYLTVVIEAALRAEPARSRRLS